MERELFHKYRLKRSRDKPHRRFSTHNLVSGMWTRAESAWIARATNAMDVGLR